jgi:branched-chain amino acid transport system ATP-binding protein
VKRLFEILANLRDAFDLTILLVEQEAEKALEFSNSALVLAQGCMMLKGEAHEMIHDPDVKRIYLGEGNI